MLATERTGWRDEALSKRHREWGQNCPAVDMDFLMCEFNHGVPVALIDYKRFNANLNNTNSKTADVLSGFYNAKGEQLPFYIVRYWPNDWAFQILPQNLTACNTLKKPVSDVLTEQQYVRFLYWLRKITLTNGDERYISRLNNHLPKEET